MSTHPCPVCHDGTLLVKGLDGYWRCPRVGDTMRLESADLGRPAKPHRRYVPSDFCLEHAMDRSDPKHPKWCVPGEW